MNLLTRKRADEISAGRADTPRPDDSTCELFSTDDALRFLAHEAANCRDHDEHEALCLLLPALMRVKNFRGMEPREAAAFREQLKNILRTCRPQLGPAGLGSTNPGPSNFH